MNHQLLIEYYSYGSSLPAQEIELFSLEFEAQMRNFGISRDFPCFKSRP